MRILRSLTLASALSAAGGFFMTDVAQCQQPEQPEGVSEPDDQAEAEQRPRRRQTGDDDRGPGRRGDGERPRGRGFGPGFGGSGLPPFPIFAALDEDRDGELSPEEIARATTALKTLDENNDGRLDRAELLPSFPPGRGPGAGQGPPADAPGRNFSARLRQLDKNNDGKITKDEAPERMQRMITRADTDGDGAVTIEELRELARERFGNRDDRSGSRPRGDRDRAGAQPEQDRQPE